MSNKTPEYTYDPMSENRISKPEPKLDAMLSLAVGMSNGGDTNEIADMLESRGQGELVNSQSLPSNRRGDDEHWEAIGFTFGEPYKDDPLFCDAEIPIGWTVKPTDHNMWSDILDPQGRKRGSIFYKAAFWDRDAFMNINRRYHATTEYGEGEMKDRRRSIVKDHDDTVLFATEWGQPYLPRDASEDERGAYFKLESAREKEARDWIDEHYPDHKNPTAYWED